MESGLQSLIRLMLLAFFVSYSGLATGSPSSIRWMIQLVHPIDGEPAALTLSRHSEESGNLQKMAKSWKIPVSELDPSSQPEAVHKHLQVLLGAAFGMRIAGMVLDNLFVGNPSKGYKTGKALLGGEILSIDTEIESTQDSGTKTLTLKTIQWMSFISLFETLDPEQEVARLDGFLAQDLQDRNFELSLLGKTLRKVERTARLLTRIRQVGASDVAEVEGKPFWKIHDEAELAALKEEKRNNYIETIENGRQPAPPKLLETYFFENLGKTGLTKQNLHLKVELFELEQITDPNKGIIEVLHLPVFTYSKGLSLEKAETRFVKGKPRSSIGRSFAVYFGDCTDINLERGEIDCRAVRSRYVHHLVQVKLQNDHLTVLDQVWDRGGLFRLANRISILEKPGVTTRKQTR